MSSPATAGGLAVVRTVAALRLRLRDWRADGDTVALVPTMGALHAGHAALIEAAHRAADRVVVSVFVNPTQFGANEDFAAYPRDEGRDAAFCDERGADLMFAPGVTEMYPDGFATSIRVAGLTEGLCGPFRPGHFDGVATVVAKLLIQTAPDTAVFGEKDFQQLVVVRRLARDLDLGAAILGVPTVREADGLAVSSRNAYLSADERRIAPALNAALRTTAARIAGGAPAPEACDAARQRILAAGFASVDYVSCVEEEALAPVTVFDAARPARVLAAARLGRTRLIDNVPVNP
ncbi:MAG: pantoate--beta-alanine ligase [Alphaproteobacteria bacterium]|nr:pantoate--beta-alanine ligase [Alphaproteobacteria bacterium]